jgi:hypothetical protein
LQKYILRINLSNKTAVSNEDSLDPGHRQGVPGKGPHHLLYRQDQILESVVRLCIDPYFRDAGYKIAKRVAVRRAGRPDLLHPHLRKVLLGPVLHPLAVVGRSVVLMESVMAISGYLRASFDTLFSYLYWKCSDFLSTS